MLLIPAIDLKDGAAVRLYKGDYDKKTIYSEKPEELAKQFEKMGTKYLHVVDLDGAKDGECKNVNVIRRIRNSIKIPIELGGGIRDSKTAKLYLEDIGINRIILGTSAINNLEFLKEMLEKYGTEKIIVGVDIKDGYISTSGWLSTSQTKYMDFINELEKLEVKYIIVTDISKDGTLEGPNFNLYKTIKEKSNINFVVSGGIKNVDNILEVNKLDYYGCIVGKAYYEGKIDLTEVIKCLEKE